MTPQQAARLDSALDSALGCPAVERSPLSAGPGGQLLTLRLADGRRVVAKLGPEAALEGFMLRWLAAHSRLPVPAVRHVEPGLLVMDHVASGGPFASRDAADHLAALHAIAAPADQPGFGYGFVCDTVIGGLPQPNPPTGRWRDFFRDQRLLFMAGQAAAAGRLPVSLHGRIERLAGRLERWLDEPPAPSLVHGDAWGGNILCRDGRVAAFIDPAIHFADAEVELAFGTLFGTFDRRFFDRYAEHRPLRPGFWEARRDLLNLYPLLVHVRLFGGSYVGQVGEIVERFV